MSLTPWGQPIIPGNYYYVQLRFATSAESSVTFLAYDGTAWIQIPTITEPSGLNTNTIAVSATIDGRTLLLFTWQSTEPIQTPSDAEIDNAYNDTIDYTFDVPGSFYFKIHYSNDVLSLNSVNDITETDPFPSSACFSEETFKKMLYHNILKNAIFTTSTYRNNTKMYRCNYHPFGTIEFTADHPFIYKGRLYEFEQLIKVHPILKKTAKEILPNDKTCGKKSKIYNVYGHYIQHDKKNIFEFGTHLQMMGGYICVDKWTENIPIYNNKLTQYRLHNNNPGFLTCDNVNTFFKENKKCFINDVGMLLL